MATSTILALALVNLLLSAQGSDICEDYELRCQLGHKIVCRERVGKVMNTALQSSVSLSCPYLNDAQSFSWTFSNSTSTHSELIPNQNKYILSLNNVNKSHEGAYICSAGQPDNNGHQEKIETFLFVAGHAYFHSCPEATNGKNCTLTQQLQVEINSSVVFDTQVAYRDGGNCGRKQEIRYLILKKNGKSVYFCGNFGVLTQYKCMNNSRVGVISQMEDKFDFKLMIENVEEADAGDYELELSLADSEGYLALSIYRKFRLLVSKPIATTASPEEATTTNPHCIGSSVQIPDLMLMLRGEVLGNNTNITHDSLGHNNSTLLCIVPDRRCCTIYQDNVKADFLWPNSTVVGDAYVTRGRQIVRLHAGNLGNLGSEMRIGKYCCTATLPDLNFDPVCVNILEV